MKVSTFLNAKLGQQIYSEDAVSLQYDCSLCCTLQPVYLLHSLNHAKTEKERARENVLEWTHSFTMLHVLYSQRMHDGPILQQSHQVYFVIRPSQRQLNVMYIQPIYTYTSAHVERNVYYRPTSRLPPLAWWLKVLLTAGGKNAFKSFFFLK